MFVTTCHLQLGNTEHEFSTNVIKHVKSNKKRRPSLTLAFLPTARNRVGNILIRHYVQVTENKLCTFLNTACTVNGVEIYL